MLLFLVKQQKPEEPPLPSPQEESEEIIPLQEPPPQYIYVPDTFNHRIQVFDKEGNFVALFGSYGSGPGQLRMPSDVIAADDRIYVLDKGNHRIQVFDSKSRTTGHRPVACS